MEERESPSQDPPAKFISLPQASIVSSNKEREYRNQSTDAERGNCKLCNTQVFPLYRNLLFSFEPSREVFVPKYEQIYSYHILTTRVTYMKSLLSDK